MGWVMLGLTPVFTDWGLVTMILLVVCYLIYCNVATKGLTHDANRLHFGYGRMDQQWHRWFDQMSSSGKVYVFARYSILILLHVGHTVCIIIDTFFKLKMCWKWMQGQNEFSSTLTNLIRLYLIVDPLKSPLHVSIIDYLATARMGRFPRDAVTCWQKDFMYFVSHKCDRTQVFGFTRSQDWGRWS